MIWKDPPANESVELSRIYRILNEGLSAAPCPDCIAKDAKIARLQTELPRWIPVTERVPDDTLVLIVLDTGDYALSNYIDGVWYEDRGLNGNVVAWMPLPAPPEVKP